MASILLIVSLFSELACIATYWEEEDKNDIMGEIAIQRPNSSTMGAKKGQPPAAKNTT